jgi:hypothetical protein
MPISKPQKDALDAFSQELGRWLTQRQPSAEIATSAMMGIVANVIAQSSGDESDLLDGIKLASDAMRSMATTFWIEKQRRR